jgi:hypothetical protein
MALAVGAPGRHLQRLVAGRHESGDQAAAVAAGALNADHRLCGAVVGKPGQQALIALRRVGEGESRYLTAALIE